MGLLVYPFTLTPGANENVNDLNGNLAAIAAVLNGNIDATNLLNGATTADKFTTALTQQLGLTNVANVGRGKSIVATSEATSSASYTTLTTPDRVASVVLPTDGILCVAMHALWASSVASAANAALFVGANNLVRSNSNVAAPQTQQATSGGTINLNATLYSTSAGLVANQNTGVNQSDVTTGQVIGGDTMGGPVFIKAAAGTYTIEVRYKTTSGSVTVFNRNLWVWTIGF